jgi:hypothetical protein
MAIANANGMTSGKAIKTIKISNVRFQRGTRMESLGVALFTFIKFDLGKNFLIKKTRKRMV